MLLDRVSSARLWRGPHVRHLLQQEGTERGRQVYGDSVWLDTAYAWMQYLHDANGVERFVIPDIRFPNELAYVQQRGGKVIRVRAPQRVAGTTLSEAARNHPSETALDDTPLTAFDYVVDNDIGEEALVDMQMRDIFEHLLKIEQK